MTIWYLLTAALLVAVSIKQSGRLLNIVALFIAPYFAIVLLNQYVMSPFFGFYAISDKVLSMLLMAQIAYFLGAILFIKPKGEARFGAPCDEKFARYHMDYMTAFLLVVATISVARVLYMLLSGEFSGRNFDDAEGVAGSGLIGHLMMVGYAVTPIVFLYGVKKKDPKALAATALMLVASFSTFIKNDIIGLLAAIVIFLSYTDEKSFKKSIVIAPILVVAVFVLNYLAGFVTRDISIDRSFYFRHLWMYTGGSLIYDNYIFTIGVRNGVSIFYKLCTFLFALPNMFTGALFGFRVFPHEKQPFYPVEFYGEKSNVVDAIGYLYPSPESTSSIIAFIVVFLCIGALFALLAEGSFRKNGLYFNTVLAFFLAKFVLLSFFGTFYVNASTWEVLVYCALVPWAFKRGSRTSEQERNAKLAAQRKFVRGAYRGQ